ncbi:hypothetical protein LJR044_000284 [Microbacterium foliorum]
MQDSTTRMILHPCLGPASDTGQVAHPPASGPTSGAAAQAPPPVCRTTARMQEEIGDPTLHPRLGPASGPDLPVAT